MGAYSIGSPFNLKSYTQPVMFKVRLLDGTCASFADYGTAVKVANKIRASVGERLYTIGGTNQYRFKGPGKIFMP